MLSSSMNKKNIDEHKINNKNTNIDVEDYNIYIDTNDEYEEYRIVSDEEDQEIDIEEIKDAKNIEEKPKKKSNVKLINKIINIILVIIITIILLVIADVILVSKFNIGPFFAIPVKTYDDGGTKEYYGLGYKVIKYNQLQGRRDTEIGSYKLKYNVEPIDLTAIDLSIEFNNNQDKAFNKYNKKFIRINGILKEYNSKDNTITIGYIDEDGKYSIDIICNMATDKRELKRIELFKGTTVIGVVTGYDKVMENKTRTLYMKDCFAEQ